MEAIAVEDALRAARAGSLGAVERLLELTRPEVAEVARAVWRPGCPLSAEDLTQEGALEVLRLRAWERFEPGAAPGRTLWPAYARKLARQAMARAIGAQAPIVVPRWGRRERKKALAAARPVVREVPYRQLVRGRWVSKMARVEEAPPTVLAEGVRATPAARAAAELMAEGGMHEVPLEAARTMQSALEEALTERAEQQRAVEALKKLPRAMRLAVAAPLGLLREGTLTPLQVARRLGKSVEQVEALRTRGLGQLRKALEA